MLRSTLRSLRPVLEQASAFRRHFMIGIHIVCAHDAVKLAETLMRLLEAEEHEVRLSYGRQSHGEIEAAKASDDAVILIWSDNAPSQHYMLEWARQIPEARLIEIARTLSCPRSTRKAPAIDFTTWRGTRGARAWNTLNDRLRTIARGNEPAHPHQKRALMALGLASIAAVGGALAVRVNDAPAPAQSAELEPQSLIAVEDPSTGIGGPLDAIEPASVGEFDIAPLLAPRFSALDTNAAPQLLEISEYSAPQIRDATLMERIGGALNPLLGPNEDSGE